jgi:hypothetical protein
VVTTSYNYTILLVSFSHKTTQPQACRFLELATCLLAAVGFFVSLLGKGALLLTRLSMEAVRDDSEKLALICFTAWCG